MLSCSYSKRWPVDVGQIGMIDAAPDRYLLRPDLLAQFESLGDNCEFGFVQRFHGVEPSGLMRWATAPIEGVITGLNDGWSDLYQVDALQPWAFDMAWDDRYKIALHGSVRCSRDSQGVPHFSLSGGDLLAALERDRAKALHLRDTSLAGLARRDRVYVVKANAGLNLLDIERLKTALDQYGDQRLLCVVPKNTFPVEGVILLGRGLKLATISQLASYHCVEMAAYGEWTALLQKAIDTPWD